MKKSIETRITIRVAEDAYYAGMLSHEADILEQYYGRVTLRSNLIRLKMVFCLLEMAVLNAILKKFF